MVTKKPLLAYDPITMESFTRLITKHRSRYDLYDDGYLDGVDRIEEWLEQNAVDAVGVIRCKECKYYEVHKPSVLENCERNGYLIPMKPDDFCSYGERKDDAV